MTPKQRTVILFFAMRRSGHHAIMRWVSAHWDSPRHFNNLNISKPRFNRVKDEVDLITLNFEDVDLIKAQHSLKEGSPLYTKIQARYGDCDIKKILILRDPFNNYASRLASNGQLRDNGVTIPPAKFIKKWAQHAGEAASDTMLLGEDCLTILYNNWFKDASYRQWLSSQLGRTHTDEALEVVKWPGTGSFRSDTYDGKAQELGVLTRYKLAEHDMRWQKVKNDETVKKLSARLYGKIL